MVIEQGLHKRLFILAGITPIKSKKMLDRMKYHVPGVDIPDEIYTRLASAQDFVHESITLTLDLMEQIKKMKGISGVHITALFWEDIIPLLVKESGCYPRPTID